MIGLEERFWSKVERGEECWLWRGALMGGRYVQQWAKENPDKVRPSVGRGLPIIHSIQVRTEGAPTFR